MSRVRPGATARRIRQKLAYDRLLASPGREERSFPSDLAFGIYTNRREREITRLKSELKIT